LKIVVLYDDIMTQLVGFFTANLASVDS